MHVVLKSFTVSCLDLTLVNDFLEEPNHFTMTAGHDSYKCYPLYKIISVSPSCCLYNRKKFISVQAVKAYGGVKCRLTH